MWDAVHLALHMAATFPHEQSFVLTQHGCIQVSTKLKVGVMWDHNGTYMEGFGFQYRDHQIVIDSTPDNKIAGESLAPLCTFSLGHTTRRIHSSIQERAEVRVNDGLKRASVNTSSAAASAMLMRLLGSFEPHCQR